jgi:hypothetical protein
LVPKELKMPGMAYTVINIIEYMFELVHLAKFPLYRLKVAFLLMSFHLEVLPF